MNGPFTIPVAVCSVPTDAVNGHYTSSGEIQYQQNITFHCDHGYTLAGSNTTTCQDNGTWSDATPNCTGMYCTG